MLREALGPIIQNAFVVRDLEEAVRTWTHIGVGPFFAFHDSSYARTCYLGTEANPDMSLAIGYWGETQIELIQQRCSTPSVYRAFLDDGREGFHHMLTTADDLNAVIGTLEDNGHELLAESDIGPNGRVIYVRLRGQRWPLLEIGEFRPPIYKIFDMARAAATGWDGRDPLRVLG